MNDEQLLRYSRHILLPQIGILGQEKLTKSCALIIGIGGLGSPVAMYLAASGIGELILCDNDDVDLTNLQRQSIHNSEAIGMPKVDSAKKAIAKMNPEINVTVFQEYINEKKLQELVPKADVVIDASDNFVTRHAINQACVAYRKPLVSGSAIQFKGQISVFDMSKDTSPCYHCLFSKDGSNKDMHCATMGIFSPLVGIIGSMQAAEAAKILLDIESTLNGRLMLLDALTMEWRSIKLNKDPECTVCCINIKQ
ncbi:MAG: molybdopterin biosynthesis protein MoeB [Nitrosomonadaceae bacterium]|nr:molybdopterin biosynthesis protein MoeB [Nitrosomonadaceae bacterium]|tara:strand:- start:7667 stop:8425 length:759 start_codon:yes stop_codon:yes gene_type:complete